MGEHRFNPVVKYLEENPGVRISSQEVKRMRKAAHLDAVASFLRNHVFILTWPLKRFWENKEKVKNAL